MRDHPVTNIEQQAATGMNRRDILKASGALAGTALAAGTFAIRPAGAQAPVELTFAFAPDDSGSQDRLIEAFNAAHEGQIRASWRPMPRQSDDYRRAMEAEFLVESPEIDVFGADIIWTAQFSYNNWIVDLTRRFQDDFERDDFLAASLGTIRFRNRVWAVPWFSDVGLLYYRRDLLAEAGFAAPPATWAELATMATAAQAASGTAHGLVFQGAPYEGGVTNALEFIWSAGGRVLTGNIGVAGAFGMAVIDPNVVTVNSEATAAGLDVARNLVADGIAPPEVAGFAEQQALDAFMAGDAVFMRNWPFAYGVMRESGNAAIDIDQVGVAPIPITPPGRQSFSCLGGWNLMINAYSQKVDAAWQFIRFATSMEMQKQRAMDGGFLPTLAGLYGDAELRQAMPVIPLAEDVFPHARARPLSPFYPDVSARLAIAFNRVLRGELTGAEAAARLDRELRLVVRKRR